MRSVPSLQDVLADEAWRYGLACGLVSIPFTATSYWLSGDSLSLSPVFVVGIVAGYLADTDRRRAGLLAGLVGSLPVLWPMLDLLAFVPGLSSPLWFRAVAVVFAIGLFAMLVLFGVVVGVLGAKVGAWLAERTGRSRPPAAGT